jgi:hypothetical protein
MPKTAISKTISFALGCIAALAGSSLAVAQDGTSRPYNGGGFTGVRDVVKQYNASGKAMRIEGSCQSSCTMLLAIRKVCLDPNATLLFHAALLPREAKAGAKPNPIKQAQMLNSYNSRLRNYLVSNGYVSTFQFHSISARDMAQKFGYRLCS